MNPVDSLPVIAEISLGLVGFTAIVAVLRRPDGGLVGWELLPSLYLLGYSSATLLLALVPSLRIQSSTSSATYPWRHNGVQISSRCHLCIRLPERGSAARQRCWYLRSPAILAVSPGPVLVSGLLPHAVREFAVSQAE